MYCGGAIFETKVPSIYSVYFRVRWLLDLHEFSEPILRAKIVDFTFAAFDAAYITMGLARY